MRLLFIHAHPVPESFGTALCGAAVETARAQGHEVRLTDLNAEAFNPVMSAQERRAYAEAGPFRPNWCPMSRRCTGPRG